MGIVLLGVISFLWYKRILSKNSKHGDFIVNNNEKRNIALLFGSGISLKALLPSTSILTKMILYDPMVYQYTGGNYFSISFNENTKKSKSEDQLYIPDLGMIKGREHALHVQKFIRCVYEGIKEVLKKEQANYEEIYYNLYEMRYPRLEEYQDSPIKPIAQWIYDNHRKLFEEYDHLPNFQQMARQGMIYIKCLVSFYLWRDFDGETNFRYLKDFFSVYTSRNNTIENLDIYSLNHDRLLEQCLNDLNLSFTDGFSLSDDGTRVWDRTLFDHDDYIIKLLKLHGDVDRHWTIDNSGTKTHYILHDYEKYEKEYGSHIAPEVHPDIIIGTLNKKFEYKYGLAKELQEIFKDRISGIDTLIVSGYGFRDEGINESIIEWLDQEKRISKALVIIHKNTDSLIENANTNIKEILKNMRIENRLLVDENYIEDTSLSNIIKLLGYS